MKRGKDEEKMMGPMFPRLHVKDAEKGGPKAPPRNKMALYEQLSIPSQRFSLTALPPSRNGSVSYSSQGGGNERGVFSSPQQPPRQMVEKQRSQYSDSSSQLSQIETRKKLDEDDFAVPIFTNSRLSQVNDRQTATPSKPSYASRSLKFSEAVKNGVIGHLPSQDGQFHKEEYSHEYAVGQNQCVKAVSSSSIFEKTEKPLKQTYHPSSHELRNSHSNCINPPDLANAQPGCGNHNAVSRECTSALTKSKCSISLRGFPSDNQDIVCDVTYDGESREDKPGGSQQMGNLERSESVSETLVVGAVFGPDITPDDVVGIIGQKQFWKARRTITNQQRAFALQVFELHRLIKVQKGMAASTLLQDVASLDKPVELAIPPKNLAIYNPEVVLPNISQSESVKPGHRNRLLVQNSVAKPSVSAAQTGGNSQAPSISSNHTPGSRASNLIQHAHQWLIPLMSPSEGLVYKPYPGSSFVFPAYGGYSVPPLGSNPVSGSFSIPTFGIPLQHPTFPPPVPQGYFPPYCMPVMTTALSGSSVEQTNVPSTANQQSTRQRNSSIQNEANVDASEDTEVQCSSSTVPDERLQGSGSMNSKQVLPLFPLSPATSTIDAAPISSPYHPQLEPARVIKVVPHHSKTASESAARIFRSIQEERRRDDFCM